MEGGGVWDRGGGTEGFVMLGPHSGAGGVLVLPSCCPTSLMVAEPVTIHAGWQLRPPLRCCSTNPSCWA